MGFIIFVIPILYALGAAAVLYAVVRFAVVHALRQARHEARIEQSVPKAATWLKGEEHRLLKMSNRARDRR